MSLIAELKGLILPNLQTRDSKLRELIIEGIISIDADLDEGGYVPTENTDNVFVRIDKYLAGSVDELQLEIPTEVEVEVSITLPSKVERDIPEEEPE